MAAVVSFLLFRTTRGFEFRATGFNRTAARGAGIPPGRTTMLAMSLSGGLVGMGSAFFGLGPAQGFSGGPTGDFGCVAIALALLAGRRPGGVVVVALLYGALTTGAKSMVIVTGIPLALLVVIVALAIMFVAAPELTRSIWRLRAAKPLTETGANPPAGPDGLSLTHTPGRRIRPHSVREWSRHSDLNRGPAVYETAALPLSYVGRSASIGDALSSPLLRTEPRLRGLSGRTACPVRARRWARWPASDPRLASSARARCRVG